MHGPRALWDHLRWLWARTLTYPKTHWLYPLIFAEIEPHWLAVQTSDTTLGEPPQLLYLAHCLGRSNDGLSCQSPIVRAWRYTRDRARAQCAVALAAKPPRRRQGRFHEIAKVRFSVLPDRQQVLLNLSFGPRYGRGWICHVRGRGRWAALEPEPRPLWVA